MGLTPPRPPHGPSATNSAQSHDTSGGAGQNAERRPTSSRSGHFVGDALFFWAALNSATLRWCSS
jgi:hypothetical protein